MPHRFVFTRPAKALLSRVCPGAEYGPAKRWPADRFRKTMELVAGEFACSWVIVSTQSDGRIAAEILEGFQGKVEDLTGKTSLRQLVEYVLKLRVLLTNDTGTMHLADGFGVPLVAVFGSTEPRLTGPRSPSSIVLRHQVECSPCFLRVPAGSSLHARRRTGRSRESRSPTPSLAPRQGSPAFGSQGVWNISVVLRLT
jgi:ADP-heptose:LPS heptosyltransferase